MLQNKTSLSFRIPNVLVLHSIKQAMLVLFFLGFQGKTFPLAMLGFLPSISSFSREAEVIVSSLDNNYQLE